MGFESTRMSTVVKTKSAAINLISNCLLFGVSGGVQRLQVRDVPAHVSGELLYNFLVHLFQFLALCQQYSSTLLICIFKLHYVALSVHSVHAHDRDLFCSTCE